MSRKNHKMVGGKLLQTNKKYSNLKMKQKEKINNWINEEIQAYYQKHSKMPIKREAFNIVLEMLYEKIEEAEIWIPYHEIEKKFLGSRMSRINKLQEQIFKEERSISKDATHIEPLE